jgi:bacillithiol biosynthesis deacetylase BshB1
LNKQKINILALGAHPDDVELSAAGTLLYHHSIGHTTAIVDLTQGELGTRGSATLRATEAALAAKRLHLSARENLNLGDGLFEENEHSLTAIVRTIRKYQPDIVLLNAPEDRHPDHARAASLCKRACFLAGLPKFDADHSGADAWRPQHVYHYIQDHFLNPDFVIDITPFLGEKLEIIRAYASQFYNPNATEPETPISNPQFWDLLTGKAQMMGRLIGVPYGEGFIASSPLHKKSLYP